MSTSENDNNTHDQIVIKNQLGWIESLKPMGSASSSGIYRPEFDEGKLVFDIVSDAPSMVESHTELGS